MGQAMGFRSSLNHNEQGGSEKSISILCYSAKEQKYQKTPISNSCFGIHGRERYFTAKAAVFNVFPTTTLNNRAECLRRAA
jgi:hypothetical protein